MAVCWISTYEEQKKRAVSFVTTAKPYLWITQVKKLVYKQDIDEIELFRSSDSGVTCYDLCIFVNYNKKDSEEETLRSLFGDRWLQINIPFSTATQMGVFSKHFARVRPSNDRSPLPNQPITPDDLYTIYNTIEQSNDMNILAYAQCHRDFMHKNDFVTSELWQRENYCYFNKLGKTHKLEGGSWLVMPQIRSEDIEEINKGAQKCRRYFELIAEQFASSTTAEGHLEEEFITKISYSTLKALVKVSNKEHPEKSIEDEEFMEDIFRRDTEVRKTFLGLQKCEIRHAAMKYKPEVFTACKLNTKNTSARLTLYNSIRFPRRLAIARGEA